MVLDYITFVIHDVLYVPEFNFNLISISKLIFTLPYSITFSMFAIFRE